MTYHSTDSSRDCTMTFITIIVLKSPFVFIYFFEAQLRLEGKLLDFVSEEEHWKNLYKTYKEKWRV